LILNFYETSLAFLAATRDYPLAFEQHGQAAGPVR
jgi:hypothetical protein